MDNTFFVVKLRATYNRDFTDAEGEKLHLAAKVIAESMRGDMEIELRRYFHDDEIFVKIEV